MHKRVQKQIEQIPHSLSKKCPAKKRKKIIDPPLLLNEFRAGMDMGKKRWLLKKKQKKREKKSCFFAQHTQFFHMVGGSRTSKTSNSCSSSNSSNSSNIF